MDDGGGAYTSDRADRSAPRGRRGVWFGVLAAVLVIVALPLALRSPNGTPGDGDRPGEEESLKPLPDLTGMIVVGFADGRVLAVASPLSDGAEPGGSSTAVGPTSTSDPSTSGSFDPETTAGTGTVPAPMGDDPESVELLRFPDGEQLLDLAVDDDRTAVILATDDGSACGPRLQRHELGTGERSELADGSGVDAHHGRHAYSIGRACDVASTGSSDATTTTADDEQVLLHYDLTSGTSVELPFWTTRRGPAVATAFSADGETVAAFDGGVVLIDVGSDASDEPEGTVIEQGTTVPGSEGATAASFVDPGTLLAAIGQQILAYDPRDLTLPATEVTQVAAGTRAIDGRRAGEDPGALELLWVTEDGTLWVQKGPDPPVTVASGVVDAAFFPGSPAPPSEATTTQPVEQTTVVTTVPTTVDDRIQAQVGGPTNHLGWHDATSRDSFYLAVGGGCVPRAQGERYLARFDSEPQAGQCGGQPNPEYRPSGYTLAIDVPDGHPTIDVRLLDPSASTESRSPFSVEPLSRPIEMDWPCEGCVPTETTFELLDPTGARLAAETYEAVDNVIDDMTRGESLATIPRDAPAGRYTLHITTNSDGSGMNSFGVAAMAEGLPDLCDVTTEPMCPRLYATDGLPIQVVSTSATAELPLAFVPTEALAGQLDIELFDPAEGATSLEILDPAGQAAAFSWSVSSGEGEQDVTALDLDVSNGVFNRKTVQITIDLDATRAGELSGWWSVRYSSFEGATDRSTWDVFLTEPVD